MTSLAFVRFAVPYALTFALLMLTSSACGGCVKAATEKAADNIVYPRAMPDTAPKVAQVPQRSDAPTARPSMTTLGSDVLQSLAAEKRGRTPTPLTAERVVASFAKEGVEVQPLKQGLGGPIGASYCAMSLTRDGVAFTLCEFADDATAEAGRKRSEARWGAGNLGRTLVVNGRSLLILRPAVVNETTTRQRAALASVFAALR